MMQEWRGTSRLGYFVLATVSLGQHEGQLRITENVIISLADAVLGCSDEQFLVMPPALPPLRQVWTRLAQFYPLIKLRVAKDLLSHFTQQLNPIKCPGRALFSDGLYENGWIEKLCSRKDTLLAF